MISCMSNIICVAWNIFEVRITESPFEALKLGEMSVKLFQILLRLIYNEINKLKNCHEQKYL
jgi:hypothetical protein